MWSIPRIWQRPPFRICFCTIRALHNVLGVSAPVSESSHMRGSPSQGWCPLHRSALGPHLSVNAATASACPGLGLPILCRDGSILLCLEERLCPDCPPDPGPDAELGHSEPFLVWLQPHQQRPFPEAILPEWVLLPLLSLSSPSWSHPWARSALPACELRTPLLRAATAPPADRAWSPRGRTGPGTGRAHGPVWQLHGGGGRGGEPGVRHPQMCPWHPGRAGIRRSPMGVCGATRP